MDDQPYFYFASGAFQKNINPHLDSDQKTVLNLWNQISACVRREERGAFAPPPWNFPNQ